MLQNIRDNIQGIAAKIIIGLMIVPFALYGIDFLFNGSGETPAAVVNGEKVSQNELNQALALQKRQLLAMMGNRIDPSMLDDAVLRKPALDSLIKQKVLLQAADRTGIAVPDVVLNSSIMQMPQFQEAGNFSPELFKQVLSAQGFSPALFRQLLRSDLLVTQLNGGIANSAFLTEFQREQAIRLGDQKRTFHYLILDADYFASQAKVSEAEIVEYYEQNASGFTAPEEVRLSYLSLKESDFYQDVPEEDVRAAYQQEIDALRSQIEREAAHILVEVPATGGRAKAMEKIQQAQQKLAAGEQFSAVAKALSEDFGSAEQGGLLGFTAGNTFPESFEQALAALEVGQVSGVVETDAGLHLVKLVQVRTPELPTYESRVAELTRELQSQKARPDLVAAVEELKDLVFNADGLQAPAKSMGLTVQETDWLSPESNAGLLANPSVKAAAFDPELRNQKLNSDVIEVAGGEYVVIHPADYKAPAVMPLEQVRKQIADRLGKIKGQEIAAQKQAELMAKLSEGQRAEDLARSNPGVEWQVAVRSWRQDSSVDAAVLRQAFAMPRPSADDKAVLDSARDSKQNLAVVQLTAVFDGEESTASLQRLKELQTSARRVVAKQSFNAFFDSLVQAAEVRIN